MIEIHDLKGTQSYGCFKHFAKAKGALDVLKNSGKLIEPNHAVSVCSYKNGVLQKAYIAEYRDKWVISSSTGQIPDFRPAAS